MRDAEGVEEEAPPAAAPAPVTGEEAKVRLARSERLFSGEIDLARSVGFTI